MDARLIVSSVMLCLVPMARGDDAVAMAERAPRDAVAVIAWAGADFAEADFRQSRLGRFWARAPVQAFLDAPIKSGWPILQEQFSQSIGEDEADRLQRILARMWRKPGMLCVFPVRPTKENPSPWGLAIEWRLTEKGAALAKEVKAWIVEEMGDELVVEKFGKVTFRRIGKEAPVYLALRTKHWILAIGRESAQVMANQRAGKRSFAANAAHRRAVQAMGETSPLFYACVNVAGMREAALKTLDNLQALGDGSPRDAGGSGEGRPDVTSTASIAASVPAGLLAVMMLLFSNPSMIGSAEFATAVGFDGPDLHRVSYARADEAHPLPFDFIGSRPIDPARLADIPKKAISLSIVAIDAAALYDQTLRTIQWYWAELARRWPDDDFEPPPEDLAGWIRTKTGLDIRKDFLSHLGDHLIYYGTRGGMGPDFCASIDVRDAEAVEAFLKSVFDRLPPQVRFEERTIRKQKYYVASISGIGDMNIPIPVSPTIVILKDRLVFGINIKTVDKYIVYLRKPAGERSSAADLPAIKAFLDEHRGQPISGLRWENERGAFSLLYPQLAMAYALGSRAIRQAEPRLELAPFPGITDCTSEMTETVSWSTVDGPVRIRHDSTGLGFSGALMRVGMAGLAVGITLPSLSRARELSKRTVCAANLRGIGQAMYIYAQDHGGNFPPDFEALIEEGTVTEKSFLCPSSAAKVGDLHACYAYIPGQRVSGNPQNVLVYEIHEPHGIEGANVLFQDAHVEFVTPYERVLELAAETKARIEVAD